ncbi:MAG: DNA mismatch endonuclease Vsr [Syntrophomonas sp.]
MTDIFLPEKRSQIMRRIKGIDTEPEMKVRRFFHNNGLRFRLHAKQLPGKPDIVFKKYKTVIFVHGCFWHQHNDIACNRSGVPKSNCEYWLPKLQKTIARDKAHQKRLKELGWNVQVIWECQINEKRLNNLLQTIKNKL